MHYRTTPINQKKLLICDDGYIRLTESELRSIPIIHLYSGLHKLPSAVEGSTAMTGFTEWQSETIPSISIGWDWHLNKLRLPAQYELDGHPYTNVQLLDPGNLDYSADESLERIRSFIHTLNWIPILTHFIQPLTHPADSSRPSINCQF